MRSRFTMRLRAITVALGLAGTQGLAFAGGAPAAAGDHKGYLALGDSDITHAALEH
jgi:hypothetical protein